MTHPIRHIAILVLLFCLLSNDASAGLRRLCKVYYETRDGWSTGYVTEVTFVTGYELNETTNSYSYQSFSNYCLIWFDQGEVAILRINSFLIRSSDNFTRSDFQGLFMISRNPMYSNQLRLSAVLEGES